MKKIIISFLLFIGLYHYSFADYIQISTLSPGMPYCTIYGDTQSFCSFVVPTDESGKTFYFKDGNNYLEANSSFCDTSYENIYNGPFFEQTFLTCVKTTTIFGGKSENDWYYWKDPENQITAQGFVNNLGSGTISSATATASGPVGTIIYVIIGFIVFVGVGGVVVYIFRKYIKK